MKTPEQIADLNMLIDRYKALPAVTNWGYGQCVMGVLAQRHVIRSKHADEQAMEVLGVSTDLMQYLISGPQTKLFLSMNPVEFRDRVVEVLEGVRDEKSVGWDGLEI